MNEVSAGVFYPQTAFVVVAQDAVDRIRTAALTATLGRARLCTHESAAASVQEMLIVQTADSYIRPHRHCGKAESLLLLEGELDAFFFNDDGTLSECYRMRSYACGGPFYYRVPALVWHSISIVSPLIVMQEVTQGPFRSRDSEFAPWSPAAGDVDGIAAFQSALRANLRNAASAVQIVRGNAT